jgi:ketosteroid isomerase-like protein
MVAELEALSERWFAAWLEKDAATVEQLAAEDYVYIGPSGWVMDRAGILAVIRSPRYRLDRAERSDVVVRVLGDGTAGVVRHRYRGSGSFEGKSFADDQRGVMVWEKRGGEWRLVMDQCSFGEK